MILEWLDPAMVLGVLNFYKIKDFPGVRIGCSGLLAKLVLTYPHVASANYSRPIGNEVISSRSLFLIENDYAHQTPQSKLCHYTCARKVSAPGRTFR